MTRIYRRFAAVLALAAFAFAQVAVSAHACPRIAEPMMMAGDAQPCPDMAVEVPNLCKQHCGYGSAAVAAHADGVPVPDLALLSWGVASRIDIVDIPARASRSRAQSAAPPPLPARPTPLRI